MYTSPVPTCTPHLYPCTLVLSPIPHLYVQVRVWDTHLTNGAAEPHLVAYKSMGAGRLFAVEFSRAEGYTLAAAGDGGLVAIWESDEQAAIEQHFAGRSAATATPSPDPQAGGPVAQTEGMRTDVHGKDGYAWMDEPQTAAAAEQQQRKKSKKKGGKQGK